MSLMPTVGRIVLYRLAAHDGVLPGAVGQVRPALVVRTWGPDSKVVNLQVFVDGENDVARPGNGLPPSGTLWATSREEGAAPGTWAWPDLRPASAQVPPATAGL